MMVLVILKASWHPIPLASASCTGSCRYHQCSSLSFESQNTCPAPWTGGGFSLECFERSESRQRCCSASMSQEHPCCKGRGHQCRACCHHSNRTGKKNCPLDNSCQCCSGAQLCSHLCNPCFG